MRRAEAEALRIRSAYKRLVLLGKATLPGAVARQLVGPDCAFHLYFRRGTLAGRRARKAAR